MTPDIPSCIGRTAALTLLLTSTSLVYAQTTIKPSSSVEELAKLKQNPVSGLRQVGLDSTLSPDVPVTGGTEGAYSLQVVWPVRLTEDWRMITYSIVPVLQLPEEDGGYEVGLGNSLFNFYATSSAPPGDFVWGVGPAILLPTRSDSDLGSDRLGLGPSAVLYYAKNDWGAGLVLQNVWSGGGDGRNEINAFGAQYILNYNLPQGWYLYSNSTITADWTADSGDDWTIPVGGGIGKIFTVGGESLSASLQGIANVVRPDDSAKWAVNFQLSILFP